MLVLWTALPFLHTSSRHAAARVLALHTRWNNCSVRAVADDPVDRRSGTSTTRSNFTNQQT